MSKHLLRIPMIALALAVLIWPSFSAYADDKSEKPWEKFSLNLGYFISALNTSARIGSGIGLDIDFEEALDMESELSVFRIDSLWRFTKNRKHRFDFMWFSLKRDSTRTVLQDIEIEDEDDNTVVIPANTVVESFLDLDLYQLRYNYSFIQDERLDIAVGLGLYVAPIGIGIKAAGLVDVDRDVSFTAPLPTINLSLDIAITPKWFIRTNTQFLYLEINQFTGSIFQTTAAIEYLPWKHVGFGLGYDGLRINIEADGEDYPGIDFKGNLDFQYTGLLLYAKFYL